MNCSNVNRTAREGFSRGDCRAGCSCGIVDFVTNAEYRTVKLANILDPIHGLKLVGEAEEKPFWHFGWIPFLSFLESDIC